MDNKIKTEIAQAKSFWDATMETSDAAPSILDDATRSLLLFALPKLENAKIRSVKQDHSAILYAMHLYVLADELINCEHNAVISNQIIKAAVMIALEECCYSDSNWSYGSKLLYELRKNGIRLERNVIAAFLAQEGTWDTNRSKGELLDGNAVAVAVYCSRLKTLCHTMDGVKATFGGTEEELHKIEVTQQLFTKQDVINYYLNEFAVPYLEMVGSANAKQQIEAFQNYLATMSDFYTAPCSTKYHLSVEEGLAEHTINVLMQMLWQALPATKQQLGACVLAAVGHDVCKNNVYKKQFKSKKTYLAEGEEAPAGAYVKHDQGGRFYWADDYFYEFKDAMPFGHGRKSAYILMSFFPEIGESVFSAVDGHMADAVSNPNWMMLYAENPMALSLHVADILATYLDEHK